MWCMCVRVCDVFNRLFQIGNHNKLFELRREWNNLSFKANMPRNSRNHKLKKIKRKTRIHRYCSVYVVLQYIMNLRRTSLKGRQTFSFLSIFYNDNRCTRWISTRLQPFESFTHQRKQTTHTRIRSFNKRNRNLLHDFSTTVYANLNWDEYIFTLYFSCCFFPSHFCSVTPFVIRTPKKYAHHNKCEFICHKLNIRSLDLSGTAVLLTILQLYNEQTIQVMWFSLWAV